MGLFSKKPKPQTIPSAGPTVPAAPVVTSPLAPQGGNVVNLSKGSTISLAKLAPGGEVSLTCSWPDKTDYDLFALVEYTDGHVEHVATFGAEGVEAASRTKDGAVVHGGDQARGDGGRSGQASETIKIVLNNSIASIVPVVYSAQSNGTGSFRRYGVSSSVVCGDQRVVIDAKDASKNENIYSLVPAVITNGPAGAKVSATEQYSGNGSENRPTVKQGLVTMDAGPRNQYK